MALVAVDVYARGRRAKLRSAALPRVNVTTMIELIRRSSFQHHSNAHAPSPLAQEKTAPNPPAPFSSNMTHFSLVNGSVRVVPGSFLSSIGASLAAKAGLAAKRMARLNANMRRMRKCCIHVTVWWLVGARGKWVDGGRSTGQKRSGGSGGRGGDRRNGGGDEIK